MKRIATRVFICGAEYTFQTHAESHIICCRRYYDYYYYYYSFFFLRKVIAFEHNNCPLTTADPGPFPQSDTLCIYDYYNSLLCSQI